MTINAQYFSELLSKEMESLRQFENTDHDLFILEFNNYIQSSKNIKLYQQILGRINLEDKFILYFIVLEYILYSCRTRKNIALLSELFLTKLSRENSKYNKSIKYYRSRLRLPDSSNFKLRKYNSPKINLILNLRKLLRRFVFFKLYLRDSTVFHSRIRHLAYSGIFNIYVSAWIILNEVLYWKNDYASGEKSTLILFFDPNIVKHDRDSQTAELNHRIISSFIPRIYLRKVIRFSKLSYILSRFSRLKMFELLSRNLLIRAEYIIEILTYEYDKNIGKQLFYKLNAEEKTDKTSETEVYEKAIKFLKSMQDKDGYWRDFIVFNNMSTDWVTAYVANSVIKCKDLKSQINKAHKAILNSGYKRNGWGYNLNADIDADSTAWGLQFLINSGLKSNRLLNVLKTINTFECESGGYRTYHLLPQQSVEKGWSAPHTCVTSVVLQTLSLFGDDSCKNSIKHYSYLIDNQSAQGYWESYWWDGRIYSTVNSIRALLKLNKNKEYKEAIERANRWLISQQNEDGGWGNGTGMESIAINTAFVLQFLMENNENLYPDKLQYGIKWLMYNQLEDGSWYSPPIMRVPFIDQEEPWNYVEWNKTSENYGILMEDGRRLFTTATVVNVLNKYMFNQN